MMIERKGNETKQKLKKSAIEQNRRVFRVKRKTPSPIFNFFRLGNIIKISISKQDVNYNLQLIFVICTHLIQYILRSYEEIYKVYTCIGKNYTCIEVL